MEANQQDEQAKISQTKGGIKQIEGPNQAPMTSSEKAQQTLQNKPGSGSNKNLMQKLSEREKAQVYQPRETNLCQICLPTMKCSQNQYCPCKTDQTQSNPVPQKGNEEKLRILKKDQLKPA
jgi:hypothetical protein